MFQREIVSCGGRQRRRSRGFAILGDRRHDRGSSNLGSRLGGGGAAPRGGRRGGGAGDVPPLFVVPGRGVLFRPRRIEAGEQAVFRQLEALLHDQGSIGVVGDVFLVVARVLDGVVDQAAEESDISAGANLAEDIGL